jgi:hypothetical protein
MLLLFIICAIVAAVFVAWLRQRVEREHFTAKTFAKRTAGGVSALLVLAGILFLVMLVVVVFGLLRDLGNIGCLNC